MSFGRKGRADVQVGLAYSDYVPSFLRKHPGFVDFVEIPFEVLHYQKDPRPLLGSIPLVLHCASLSMAGATRPTKEMTASVGHWVKETRTPWLGEHLAYITAFRPTVGRDNLEPISNLYDTGYSIPPPMNAETVRFVIDAVEQYANLFKVPILLENSPLYFATPGSTMTQVEFINQICTRSEARVLLDLAHLYISGSTQGFDQMKEIHGLPLDRIDEIHISGIDTQDDSDWDDHTKPAPDFVFEMLAAVLSESHPRAITLEYNWSVNFPESLLLQEITRTQRKLRSVAVPT